MTTITSLQRDISTFIDPATKLKLMEGAHGLRMQFTRNGNEHDYFINPSEGSVVARHAKDKKYASLKSLLASREFSDVRGFTATQVRMYKDFNVDELIPPEGDLDSKKLAMQTLHRSLTPHASSPAGKSSISVVLLDGPAGVGKTSLIQRMLVQRARGQQDVSSAPPILHVASRGRRLTALDEALAQSIQILRAQFTFDQVSTLIRHNLIQLAIDGFDELVDPEGYKDAWFALRDFFDSTEFGGPIILAGRDTFFDQQSFTKQMKDSKHSFQLAHVRLSPVSVATAKSWLTQRGWKEKDLSDPYANLVLRPGSYALRPYFLNELSKAKGWKAIESKDLSPRAFLLNEFVMREARLIGEQLSLSADDIRQKLFGIFEEIALEMADNEADSVDLSFLQLVTEFAFGDSLDHQDLAKLRHKAGSFALLESDARDGYRRFPHTEISHHFLAQALIRLVSVGTSVRFLRRGIVTSDLLAIFAEILSAQSESNAVRFIEKLEQIASSEVSFDRLTENVASLLVTGLCRTVGETPRHYQDLQITNAVLFGLVAPASLERVRIQRLDAKEAGLTQVEFHECHVVDLIVDETTRFGSSIPAIHQIHLLTDKGTIREIFAPEEIATWIDAHSVKGQIAGNENQGAIRLLEKVCRIMLRQHMIKDHESDEFGRVLKGQYWEEIEEILKDAGCVDRISGKQMSGVKAPFVRMQNPYELLAQRSSAKVARIWEKVGTIPE